MTLPKDWEHMSIYSLQDEFAKQRQKDRESPKTQSVGDHITLIDAATDWSDDIPPLEWTVQDLIPKRQVCLFSGHGAAGKSTIALHLACAHALGLNFLNFMPEPGTALVFDAEDEVLVMRHRVAAILKHYGKTLKDLNRQLLVISRAGQNAILATANHGVITPTPLYLELEQIVADLRPRQLVIASSANVFAGNEIDRTQVTQFIAMLTRLAITADGSVILISHPSLTGMSTGSGISGSTSWHNSVRAQMYLEGIKDEGEEEAEGLRKLIFKKNQYGNPAATVTLKWQDGMFLPPPGQTDYQQAATVARWSEAFLTVLKRYLGNGINVSHKPSSNNYAPARFITEPEFAGAKKINVETAMRSCFRSAVIKVQTYGAPSRGNERIVLA